MKNPKISVIVPVYNVEKYLDICLDCLVNQTYSNLEIIVINDCSKDNSEKIIKKYLNNFDNIIYVKNKENRGLSFARNVGLEKSSGEYIGYIDSDDYVSYEYYESLMNTMIREKADVVVCDINTVYENDNASNRNYCGSNNNEKIDFINNGFAASACNKLFKRKNIQEYKFSVGKVNEDLAVIMPIVIKANKVAYNDEVFYNYVQRNNSIQNSSISDKRFDIFYGVNQTLERIKDCNNYLEYKDAIIYNQLITFFLYVIPKEKRLFRRAKLLRKYHRLVKQYEIMKNQYLWNFLASQGKKHRIYYSLLFKLNNSGFSFIASLVISLYRMSKLFNRRVIKNNINLNDLIILAKKQNNRKKEKISVSAIIPNYNYERFLYQRLYSILNQQYKINEIIILDDYSSDNSRQLIDDVISKLSKYIDIKKEYNTKNSGSAFKQWEKGMDLAKSNYVWIAEADDYCDKRMLKNLIKPVLKNNKIIISYCNTAFIDVSGNIIMKSIVPEIDIMKTGHWNNSYINKGSEEFKSYSFLNCTIANVSSCIIKKENYKEEFKLSGKFKQAGDWLFYVNIMHKGYISYCNKAYNYYRLHGNNVSSVTKKQDHLNELIRIHNYYDEKYKLTDFQKAEVKKRYSFLKKVWNLKD